MRPLAGGRGPRAAPDRRPQAAVQPPLEVSGAHGLAEADRRGVPAAVAGRRGSAPTAGPTSVRSRSRHAAELAAAGGLRGAAGAPVHPAAVDPAGARPRARWPSWAGAPPRASCEPPRGVRAHAPWRPFSDAIAGDPGRLVEALLARIERLAAQRRYEDAARVRARLAALLRAAVRMQRLTALTALPEVVAARPEPGGGWEIAVIRHGRLVAAGTVPAADRPADHAGRPAGHGRDGPARSRPGPVRQRRGDRTDPGLAGAARRSAWSSVRWVGRTRCRRRPASAGCSPRSRRRSAPADPLARPGAAPALAERRAPSSAERVTINRPVRAHRNRPIGQRGCR